MDERIRKLNDAPIRPAGRYVLYWCRSNRRVESNHALLFAAGLANQLRLPLLFLQELTCTYPCANDRLHTFALEGVPETEARLRELGIGFAFHLQRRKCEPADAVHSLAADAAAVVTDDCPLLPPEAFCAAGFAIDSSCIVPARSIDGRAYAAYALRPKIERLLPRFLKPVPAVRVHRPCRGRLAALHTEVGAASIPALVASCEIDHGVPPSISFGGGRRQARRRLERFLRYRLSRYAREKNDPAAQVTSDLSPYLHYGYISSLEIALAVRGYAAEHKLEAGEFLEELIVRRELAFNFVRHAARVDSLEELPAWARATLDLHRGDRRDPLYTAEQFEAAATCDRLWNATQKELLLCGKIHGYYRMYWGKKVLEWSAKPEDALATMIYLHDRYALDGQDPNTYANILWCFGLHDRPWPERPVYGTVRSMSLAGMERKTNAAAYISRIEGLERAGRELSA
jgi:deoxyribodipyrimidine photo-lyase